MSSVATHNLTQQKLQQLLIAKLSPRIGVIDDTSFGTIKEMAAEYISLLEEKYRVHEELKIIKAHLPKPKDFWENPDAEEKRKTLIEKNIALVGLNERSLAAIKKFPPALLDAYIDYVETKAEEPERIAGNKREEVALRLHGAIIDCAITSLVTPPTTRDDYMVPSEYIEARYAKERWSTYDASKRYAAKSFGAAISGPP